jgi:N-acetylglucosaminyldiphosphoundecaprenol N-acetyl-beta-D-mannosaminyltransferase
MTGADWIHDFCQQAQQVGLRLYILAGEPGIARLASDNLQNKYPGLKIVGCSDGWFSERSQSDVIHEINAASPHVVFIGLGVPRQEKWIAGRRKQIEAPVCWGVGALFDYVAGVEARVPRLMNLLALEWFWRLIMDPRGKWRRYLLGNPLFIYQVLRQKYGL